MAIWDTIGRELRHLWEILTTGEAQPDEEIGPDDDEEIPEDEPETGGGFFGDDEPEEPPPSGGAGEGGYFTYQPGDGPYPDNWGDAEIRFWDRQMGEHIFDNEAQYDQAQEYFYLGYMAGDDEISHEDRVQAREDFLDETYFDAIDWDAFADYYNER